MPVDKTPHFVRPINADEQAACAAIYQQAWRVGMPDAPRIIEVDEFIRETAGETTLVAESAGQIVGYISIWRAEWFIHHLYVSPAWHGQGVGSTLLNHVRQLAAGQVLSLKCQQANLAALNFYQAMGFVQLSERGVDDYGGWVRLGDSAGH